MKRLLPIIAVMALLAACSSSDSKEARRVAEDYAKTQAERLIQAKNDTVEIQKILLETRAKEEQLRLEGHEKSADAYIKKFESTIREVNDSLGAAIFDLPYIR